MRWGRAVARALLHFARQGSAAFASKGLDAAIAEAGEPGSTAIVGDKWRAKSSTPDDDGDGDAPEPANPPPIDHPADSPTVEEIVAVMRHAPDDRRGWHMRAMIVVLWRAGLRIHKALALAEHDLDHRRGSP